METENQPPEDFAEWALDRCRAEVQVLEGAPPPRGYEHTGGVAKCTQVVGLWKRIVALTHCQLDKDELENAERKLYHSHVLRLKNGNEKEQHLSCIALVAIDDAKNKK